MQTIVTKYHGPTNTRGSRVSASAQVGKIVLTWDDELSSDDNHLAAATALAGKYGWLVKHRLVSGGLPDGTGNCYVLVSDDVRG